MFIHIGGDTMVRLKDVVGIFDIQANISPSPNQSDTYPSDLGYDVKSFVVTQNQVYYSQVSSQTLKRRAAQLNFLDESE